MRMTALALAAVLAGCAASGPSQNQGSTPSAQLSDAIVGRPIVEAMAQVTRGETSTARSGDGTEVVTWTQSRTDQATGGALTCEEQAVVRDGFVTAYRRAGTSC